MKSLEAIALSFEKLKEEERKWIIKNKKVNIEIRKENIEKAKEIIDKALKQNIKILTFFDKNYPSEFLNIYKPPFVIFYKGNINVLKRRKIAIIGTRKPTKYGKEVAYHFSSKIASYGIVIVSGGARGIDTIAHKGALDSKGKTICILGCGIDYIYPFENKRLFEKITEKGLILTEYPPGTKPFSYHFPMRNRLIAGLSEYILVVEGGEKSGTFITVKWGLDFGKEIFAIPGEIYSDKSKGPNFLIKQGAIPVTSPEEVAEYMGINIRKEKKKIELSGLEREIFNFLKENGRKNIDEIQEYLKKNIGEILGTLMNLEIKGIILNEGNGYYSLKNLS